MGEKARGGGRFRRGGFRFCRSGFRGCGFCRGGFRGRQSGFAAQPTPATKPQPGPVAGAITLGLGILLLIIGAVGHASIIVIGGLVAAAWGIWRLVTGTGTRTGTGTGSNTKPPGQT